MGDCTSCFGRTGDSERPRPSEEKEEPNPFTLAKVMREKGEREYTIIGPHEGLSKR